MDEIESITVGVGELKDGLSEFLNRATYGQERIIVISRGHPKAAIISLDDLHRLEKCEELADALAAWEVLYTHQMGNRNLDPWERIRAELMDIFGVTNGRECHGSNHRQGTSAAGN